MIIRYHVPVLVTHPQTSHPLVDLEYFLDLSNFYNHEEESVHVGVPNMIQLSVRGSVSLHSVILESDGWTLV